MHGQLDSEREEVTAIVSRFIAETDYDDLPEPITDRVKKSILDTIGIIIPASELMPDLENAIDLYIEAGGKEESTVLAYGVKLPCWAAAFANGVRAHALDYADGHLEAVFRIGVSVIPAALALAERKGAVSGKELIAAVGVAEEFLCRLGVSVARRRKSLGPWHCGILLGNFGATAAAAKMLNLNADQIDRAFGIAFLQAGGTVGVTAPDANIRGMYAGFVGQTGVLAALMAQRGLLGPRGCLGSPDGLFDVYFQRAYDRQALVDNLGSEFELINLSFKPWPACAFAHPYIDASIENVLCNIESRLAQAADGAIEIEQPFLCRSPQHADGAREMQVPAPGLALPRNSSMINSSAPSSCARRMASRSPGSRRACKSSASGDWRGARVSSHVGGCPIHSRTASGARSLFSSSQTESGTRMRL